MANTKKSKSSNAAAAAAKPAAAKPAPKPTASTAVRHSAVPKMTVVAPVAAPAPRVVTHDMIAARAYEIWSAGTGGSEFDNWCRAEGELRAA